MDDSLEPGKLFKSKPSRAGRMSGLGEELSLYSA